MHWSIPAFALFLLTSPAMVWAFKPTYAADVFFEYGSSSILPHQAIKLEELMCKLAGRTAQILMADGHADAYEADAEKLSIRRAEQVIDWFKKNGIVGVPVGKGIRQPFAENKTALGRSKNRRVEIELIFIPSKSSAITSCEPTWPRQMLALNGDHAVAVARTLLKQNKIKAEEPFVLATKSNRPDILAALLAPTSGIKLPKDFRTSVFLAAASTGSPQMISMLIKYGIKLNEFASPSEPLLSAVCRGGHVEDKNREQAVRDLMAWGSMPLGFKEDALETPLGCAAQTGQIDLLNLLLSKGANPNLPKGLVVNAGHRPIIVKRLLEAGANPLARSSESYGDKTLFYTYRISSSNDIDWLIGLGLDINDRTKNGQTPLHEVVRYGTEKILDAMVEAGAKFQEEQSWLLVAANGMPLKQIWLIERGASLKYAPDTFVRLAGWGDTSIPVMKVLLQKGVGINSQDHQGWTALGHAISNYQKTMVAYLLSADASTNDVKKGLSAMQVAQGLDAIVSLPPSSGYSYEEIQKSQFVDRKKLALKEEILKLLRDAEK
jgi:prepilin-type processing-associated H-X9-DG protein